MSQITTLETIKEYRNHRDGLFKDLAEMEHGTPEYDAQRDKIYDLDEAHDHFIDESMEGTVHAESFNFGDIKRTFQHIPHDLGIDPHALQDAIRGEMQHVLQEVAAPLAKQTFKTSAEFAKSLYWLFQEAKEKYPEFVDEINKIGIPISLSVVNLRYGEFMTRAEGLCRLLIEQSEHFQFNRHSIKWIIENTGPSQIGVNISGELITSVFSFSIGVDGVSAKLGALIVDLALKKAGVPE